MAESITEQFVQDGYFVVPELLGPEHCAELLADIVESFHSSPPTPIKEPTFRRHSPLALSESVNEAISMALEYGYTPLANFLKTQQELVELSSITVFPNAAAQALHRDEANEGHYLVSVFINLAETRADTGALTLIPASHHLDIGGRGEPIAIEVPAGSAVFMNSKLLHNGAANTSSDRIRSVLYFTMGETGLYGPPYSILDEVAQQALTLEQLQPRLGQSRIAANADSRPQLLPDCSILLPLSSEDSRTKLLLCQNNKIRRTLVLDKHQDTWIDLLQEIECHPRELSIADLAQRHKLALPATIESIATLARDGWLCW
ncbi:MAG: phytanoyl-CoA dioxygenase family protein [Kofleriaceae bacterium]|nr:phytanoyl-CoA dioxygenase family protein [Kofleriaceae bacterium]